MNTPRQLTLDLVNPPQPSLANFVVGRNAEVIAALRAVAAGAGERFIYLWGESGSGRTHLMQALGQKADVRVPEFDTRTHLFLVDDIELISEDDQQRLFVLLNEVRSSDTARFIGAGNAAPMHLPLRDDIRTRLAWGLVYPLHALSDAEKAQALTAHAATRGLALSTDVVDYLMAHMPRDMRKLVAIVDALDEYALSEKRSVTVPLARQWAQQGSRDGAP